MKNQLLVFGLILSCMTFTVQVEAKENGDPVDGKTEITRRKKHKPFHHGIGAGLSIVTESYDYNDANFSESYSGGNSNPGIVYNPYINFKINRDMSFNVATYPLLGFNLSSRGGSSFGLELPVVGELFFGDIEDTGGFVGLGFNYATGSSNGSVFGPQVSGGGQFEFQDKLVKLRGGYTLGLNREGEENGFTNESYGVISLTATVMIGYN